LPFARSSLLAAVSRSSFLQPAPSFVRSFRLHLRGSFRLRLRSFSPLPLPDPGKP
jgi:hypothetical protein